jgi:hypothetical protein
MASAQALLSWLSLSCRKLTKSSDISAVLHSRPADFVDCAVAFFERVLQRGSRGCDSQNSAAGRNKLAGRARGSAGVKDVQIM